MDSKLSHMPETPVSIRGVKKVFNEVQAVAGVSVDIRAGELFTLLGPSGCGKTTLLRILAGFLRQEEGQVYFGDTCIDDVPAYKRNTGMVFQNYAIFPHLNVRDNIAYGLKHRGLDRSEIEERVAEVVALTNLQGLETRSPRQLSGGQQQRVVLARAIVVRPRLLLMDEPLSNLDAKLKIHLRYEIRELQRRLGLTTVYVTHDQEEALSISDRIAVMQAGKILQIGSPEQVYRHATHLGVARFIGEGNFLPIKLVQENGEVVGFLPRGTRLKIDSSRLPQDAFADHSDLVVSVRPQDIRLSVGSETLDHDAGVRSNMITGTIVRTVYLGGTIRYFVDIGEEQEFFVDTVTPIDDAPFEPGSAVELAISPRALTVFVKHGDKG